MADKTTSFLDQIPAPIRMGLVLLLLFIVGYVLYGQVFRPRLTELENLDKQIATLETQVAQLETQVRGHVPIGESEREEWRQAESELAHRIPPDHQLPSLIEEIAILAHGANLEDTLISTSEKVALSDDEQPTIAVPQVGIRVPTSADQARGMERQMEESQPISVTDVISAGYFPITITFHGSFRNQGKFLEQLAKLPQLVEFENVDIQREYPETGFRLVLRSYHSGGVNRV